MYSILYVIGAVVPPSNVRAQTLNSTAIFIEWNVVDGFCRLRNGLITSYSIKHTEQPNGTPQIIDQVISLNFTLNGLTPFTEYSIEVAAVNEVGGVGVYSDPQVAMTLQARMSIIYLNSIS